VAKGRSSWRDGCSDGFPKLEKFGRVAVQPDPYRVHSKHSGPAFWL
jgi:hypothetical protein